MNETLAAGSDVYFEAGNHEELVHMSTDDFLDLMADVDRARFAHRL